MTKDKEKKQENLKQTYPIDSLPMTPWPWCRLWRMMVPLFLKLAILTPNYQVKQTK